MGVGHAAVALGASKAAPRLNVGWLVFGALLADFLLGVFAWMGLEHARAPNDFASRHYLLFTFPYSHGLVPLAVWGALFGLLVSQGRGRDQKRAFWVVAAVVVSHFVLDGLVHVAGLPILGENSPKLGLGLWNHMPLELSLETLMAGGSVVIYLRVAGAKATAWSRWGMPVYMALLAGLTWTQLLMTRPPTMAQLVPNWIVAPVVFAAIPFALDRKRTRAVCMTVRGEAKEGTLGRSVS
jgi:hypothetical protein